MITKWPNTNPLPSNVSNAYAWVTLRNENVNNNVYIAKDCPGGPGCVLCQEGTKNEGNFISDANHTTSNKTYHFKKLVATC